MEKATAPTPGVPEATMFAPASPHVRYCCVWRKPPEDLQVPAKDKAKDDISAAEQMARVAKKYPEAGKVLVAFAQ